MALKVLSQKTLIRDREELKNDLAGFQAACVYLSHVNKTKSINMARFKLWI